VAESPPRTSFVRRCEADIYAAKADLITVRHRHGDVVAVIEIVSQVIKEVVQNLPHSCRKPPPDSPERPSARDRSISSGNRDPQGIHKAIWDEFQEEEFELPSGKRLTLAAYDAGPPRVAYVESIAVGDAIPSMPLFLKPEVYVPARWMRHIKRRGACFPRR